MEGTKKEQLRARRTPDFMVSRKQCLVSLVCMDARIETLIVLLNRVRVRDQSQQLITLSQKFKTNLKIPVWSQVPETVTPNKSVDYFISSGSISSPDSMIC